MRGDGDGWALGANGVRHWGRFGAAGLLLRAPLARGGSAVLLQHRAPWSHQGDTWALPGGARDSDESAVLAAVREAWEETGIKPDAITVRGERVTASAPSGWTYTTVIADAERPLPTTHNLESTALAWIPEDEVESRPLHPGFAAAWPGLRAAPARLSLVELADSARLARLLPRTVDLADRGFLWLHTDLRGPGDYAHLLESDSAAVESGGLAVTRAQLLS
ncbi:NUDIX hydrolase [Nocardia panacis]|uniref:NUDIX hydrolase n=1 Tax=Nocardia panacis TaxID=2340916 RepID=A0A3A4K7V7_9NOCA|nr:NUDIX hydrolase [Nocardia panacis]RJO77219.1 NUDIX hydrolase [Nocardia panacis]